MYTYIEISSHIIVCMSDYIKKLLADNNIPLDDKIISSRNTFLIIS